MKIPRLVLVLFFSLFLFSCATEFQNVKRAVYLKDPNQKPLQAAKTDYRFDFMKPESLATPGGAKLVVQQAHVSPKGTRVAISPDEKFYLTLSESKELKLWSAKGLLVGTLAPKAKNEFGFSRDGTMIYAYVQENGEDNKESNFIKLFRTDGKETASISLASFIGDPLCLDLNADKSLAAAAYGQELVLFDTATQKIKLRLKPDTKYKPRVRLAVCAPEKGRYFISGEAEEGSIYKQVWTTYLIDETGKVLKDYGRGVEVRKMFVSQDGKNLVVQTPAGISVWNVETGRSVNFAPTAVKLVAVARDGLIVTRDKADKIVFYSLAGGAVKEKKITAIIGEFQWASEAEENIHIGPEGNFVITTGNKDGAALTVWTPDKRMIRKFDQSTVSSVTSFSIGRDGKSILAGYSDGYVRVWDTYGALTSCSKQPAAAGVAFLDQPGKFAVGIGSGFRILNGNEKPVDVTASSPQRIYATNPNGKYFAAINRWGTISMFSANGELVDIVYQARESIGTYYDNVGIPYVTVAFTPDDSYLVGLSGAFVSLWPLEHKSSSFNRTNLAEAKWAEATALAVSPDGKQIAYTKDRNSVEVIDFAGKPIRSFSLKEALGQRFVENYLNYISALAYSPDGSLLVMGTSHGRLFLYKAGGEFLQEFKGHDKVVTQAQFLPDGKHLVTASGDGILKIWNVETGYSLNCYADREEWICYSDEGYFDASRNGGKLVGVVKDGEVYAIDQFAVTFNRPDTLYAKAGYEDKDKIEHYYGQFQKRLKKLNLTEEKLAAGSVVPTSVIREARQNGKTASLSFDLREERSELASYNVYVNDVPLFGSYGKKISGKGLTVREEIELTPGENKIEVACANAESVESFRDLVYLRREDKAKGSLYYLGFGVSKYKDSGLNLQFADKDAKDLEAVYAGMQGAYEKVYTKLYLNENVTVANIKAAKDFLKNAKADDTFVLFIAGHGVHDRDKEATYYYLTHDADKNNLAGTCANFELVEDLLQGIAPRNKLFLMDTCESGEIDDEVQNKYFASAGSRGLAARTTRAITIVGKDPAKPEKRAYLFQKDRYIYNDLARRSGAIVFSSCRGGEFSYESDKIGNGYFTKAIIGALKGEAAKDGVVSVEALRTYVEGRVAKDTQDLQHPTVDRDNLYQKFVFPAVK